MAKIQRRKGSKLAIRSKTLIQVSFLSIAVAVAFAAIVFDVLMTWAQEFYLEQLKAHPIVSIGATPVLFLIAAALVVFAAPQARGSGIPQVLKAMLMSLGSHQTAMKSGLISLKTAGIKVISAIIAILGGASIGREGPTVQISTALFAWIGSKTKKSFPHVDFHSYLVAGSAAGVAAAFNTPLAGIAFALEELAEGSFVRIKQTVMVSVIIAGIATQSVLGNYLFFGHPHIDDPNIDIVLPAILIGLTGGLMGGLFAKALAYPIFDRFNIQWWQRVLVCGVICAAIGLISKGQSQGSGYEITRAFMDGRSDLPYLFPVGKMITTIFSYLAGFAGGIFSPSLAIGAGWGVTVAKLASFASLKTCALLGMVAFFTGAVHAPLTAVIIVMEMTDNHVLIIPLMASAFIAQGTSKLIMPQSLYHHLALHRTDK